MAGYTESHRIGCEGNLGISKLLSNDLGLRGICPPYIIACWETLGDCLGVIVPLDGNILKDGKVVTFYFTVIVRRIDSRLRLGLPTV